MVKILITTIQVNFCAASQNLPELSLLKFLPLTYHHSHFLAATLDFTSFFTIAFLRAAHIFLQLGCFGLDLLNSKQDDDFTPYWSSTFLLTQDTLIQQSL